MKQDYKRNGIQIQLPLNALSHKEQIQNLLSSFCSSILIYSVVLIFGTGMFFHHVLHEGKKTHLEHRLN